MLLLHPTEMIGEYLRVPFSFLGDYWLDEPDWRQLADSEYVASLSYDTEIPDKVKQLDEKKVAITGFMLPIDVDEGKVKRSYCSSQRCRAVSALHRVSTRLSTLNPQKSRRFKR